MSLGSSDMAGSALGMSFSLLLLASIIQGFQDVEVFHYEKMEAGVGQNIENNMMGSHLELSEVTKWDSGVYICDLTTFPLGSIRRETVLEIKDVKITCNVNNSVEVHAGKNVTIQCSALPNAQYRWTKNKKLVSENESLALLWVTDAHSGIYTLTVNTGYKSLHKEFIISVLTATTSLRTDLLTISPQSNVTEKGLIKPTDSSFTTSPTIGLSTIDTNVTWTTNIGTDVTDDNPNPSNVTFTAGHTNYTHTSVTSSPATHTDPYHFNISNNQTINPTHTLKTSTFSDQSVSNNLSTTLSYGSRVTRNESIPYTVHSEVNSSTSPEEPSTLRSIMDNRGGTPTLSTGNVTVTKDEGTDGVRSHLLLVVIMVPVLLLIAVACFLYRRQIKKDRMDLPPPFKPPPPPVKYAAVGRREISTQPFPSSRCNSVDFKFNASFIEQ
ncbi:uncharacterized protein ABDE67_010899 [Symphorus nematophorus]